jgi:hypothetical protein
MRRPRTACPKRRGGIKLSKKESEVKKMIPHDCHLLLYCLNSKVLQGRTVVNNGNHDVVIIILLKGGKEVRVCIRTRAPIERIGTVPNTRRTMSINVTT